MSAAAGRDTTELHREETVKEESHDVATGQGVAPEEHQGEEREQGEAALKQQVESGRQDNSTPARTSPHPSLHAWDTRTATPPQTATSSYQPPTSSQPLLPPADFKPFFTLIHSPPDSNEFLHPDVHYVFADDDEGQGTLTSVALEAIERQGQDGRDEEERVVVVDMAADGRSVVGTTSLSGAWQGVRAEVAAAPSWGGSSSQQGDGSGGLMLTVSGRERGGGEQAEVAGQGLEALLEKFGRQLDGLDEVLGEDVDEIEDKGEGGGSGRG